MQFQEVCLKIPDLIGHYSLLNDISDDFIILYNLSENKIIWRNDKSIDEFKDIIELNNILNVILTNSNNLSILTYKSNNYSYKYKTIKINDDTYSIIILKDDSLLISMQNELNQLKMFMNEISEITNIGGWLIDVNKNKLMWNENVYKIHELSNNINPTVEQAIEFYTDEYKPIISKAVTESINNLQKFDVKAQIRTKNGNLRWVKSKGKSIINSSRNIIVYGTIQDITEELKENEEKKLLTMQLDHKNRMDAIGQIAGGVAHDFNNILGGILNACQLLEMTETKLSDIGKKYLNLIQTSSENATDLTQKLLTFSRKDSMEFKHIDIIQIIRESKLLISKSLNKNVTIKISNKCNNFVIKGNYSALENLIINMCLNSSHAMPNGGVIDIYIDEMKLNERYCERSSFDIVPGNYIKVLISDTGVGISEKNLNKIFEPFYTTKEIGKGSGLGLSTAYGIIESHKGEITVKSGLNVGTTFTILIPSATDNDIVLSQDEKPNMNLSGTILVVDDEEINRFLCKKILEHIGFNIIEACDGEDAILKYKTFHNDIDIVILDMIMPKLNGYETFNKLKELNNSVKVVVTSGYSDVNEIEEMKRNGLKGFLSKPFRKQNILELLNQII